MELSKLMTLIATVNSTLRKTDIPERVKATVELCGAIEEIDPKVLYAVAMTAISHLLLEGKIALRKED